MYTVDSITTPFTLRRIYSASAIDVEEVQTYLTKIGASYGIEKKTPLRGAEHYEALHVLEGGLPHLIIAHIVKYAGLEERTFSKAIYPLLTHGVLTKAPERIWRGIKDEVAGIDYAIVEDEEKRQLCWAAGLRLLNAIDKILGETK